MHKQQPRWILSPKDKNLTIPFLKGLPVKALENERVQYQAETPQGKIRVVANLKDTFEVSKGDLYQDMCEMNVLNEPEVLRNLVQRYKRDDIFTYIGPTLIVVNPYRIIERHFNPKLLADTRDQILKGNLKGAPHIFMIAGRAFQGLVCGEGKQAIVISGQSGAGKTESTKYCMQMITNVSHRESHSIQKKILACNPLLEAFGNSKTVRNDNSSRFGKYVQIFFGSDNTIKGANIISYLLEKSRVVSVAQNQRTFHAFYCLTAARHMGAKEPTYYSYLKQSGCYTAANMKDGEYFKEINQSMTEIGFSKEEQDKIWALVLAILEMGNLEFDDKKHHINESSPCQIVNKADLPKIAKVLGISPQNLQKILVFEKKVMLKETSFKAYNKLGCISNRNTFSKAIYNSIFEFIIYKIELALNPHTNEPLNSINLLDIFGFENFKENSLEQLCINFTNEKLLKQYNKYVFENQMVILREDGLEKQIQDIKPPTNDDVIALLCSKLSLFSIINDNTPNQQYKDADMMHGFKRDFSTSKLLKFDLINKQRFTIVHSQCQVTYNIDGFKLKNQDKVNSDIQEIYTKLFINQNKNQVGKTLLLKFVKEIDDLVNELSSASNHFVRCIKPNEEKKPKQVQQTYLLTQVRYLGVFQTIQIRQKTFPARKIYSDFISTFQQVFNKSKGKPEKEAVQIILREVKAKEKDFLLGIKRIYMNKDLQDKLNKELYNFFKIKNEKAAKIQKAFKRYMFKKYIFINLKKLVMRKKLWKKFAQRQRIKLQKHAFKIVSAYSENKKKIEQERKRQQLQLQKERAEKLRLQELARQQKEEEFKKIKKESEKSKLQSEPAKKIEPMDAKSKQNESLKGLFGGKKVEEVPEDMDTTVVMDSEDKSYKRLQRPQETESEIKQGRFNESFTEGHSVYISSGSGVAFEKTIQIDIYEPKDSIGNIDKLQKILAEQYKVEINGNQQEFFSPNSADCIFKIEDTPSDLLNKIACFPADDFFKRVLRKRTTFLGMSKDYRDVLVAKNRAMTKTLTLMDEADEEKALKVFKVIVRIGEEAKLDNVFRLIENMIALCQSTSQELKNQVFLQLIKQSNTSHELASIRIYQSMAVFLHIYIPDQDFIMAGLFLLHHKLQEQRSSEKEEQYLRYLFKKMMRKIDSPPIIGYMPIKYQMMALMCKRQISIPVYLPVGNSILIRVESYDTFADIKARVIRQFGIDNRRLRAQMFRFFQIVNFENEQLEESPLNENQIVWDIMTYWQLAKEKYKEANSPPPAFFLMLKIVYAFEVYPDDVEGVELCFAQCYFDYFIGRVRLDFDRMAGLAACVKKIKLPNRPETEILGSFPIWMAKRYERDELADAMIENIRQMEKEGLDLYQMKFRFLQICDECPLSMSMAIPTEQTIKLFFKPKKIYLTEKCEIKEEFSMRNIVKWAIDKEKFVFDVKGSKSHAIFTEYAHICSQFLSELPKVLKKQA